MVANITYTKTSRGQRAYLKGLPDPVRQVLTVIDGDVTEEDILNKLDSMSKEVYREAMTWLLEGGFIRLSDDEAFSFSQPNASSTDAIQVHEISIDEFSALKTPEEQVRQEEVSAAVTKVEKEVQDKAIAAKKEKARLDAIAKAKQITRAKEIETARLKAEAEQKIKLEIAAKKEEWARVKIDAENKTKADQKAQAEAMAKARVAAELQQKENAEKEAKAKADEWARLKAEAKVRAEEEAKLETIARAEEEVKRQRLASKARAKNRIQQWLIKPFNFIKSLFVFVFVALCLALIAAHFINIPILIPPIERFASEALQDSVHIQSINIRLLPKPHLLLKNVRMINHNHIQAQSIRAYPNLANLKDKIVGRFTVPNDAPFEMQSIKLEGLEVAQKDFPLFKQWRRAAITNQQYILHQLAFSDLSLKVNRLSLPLLYGDAFLNTDGSFKRAVIHSKQEDFALIVNAVNGDYLMDVNAMSWRLPIAPFPVFSQLNATGVIKEESLTFSSITGQLYDGHLSATLETNLASPKLASKGRFKLNNLVIDQFASTVQLNTAVTGILSSNGSFSFAVSPPANSLTSTNINANFNIKNGVVKKIDITEAMRTKNINGSTNFSSLTGNVAFNNKRYQFNNLLLQDKQLQAHGQVTIFADQHVTASISSSIAVQGNPIKADLIIEGPMTRLKLIN